MFDLVRLTLDRRVPRDTELASSISLSPGGRYLALVTKGGELRVLDAVSGQRLSGARTPPGLPVWSENGRKLNVSHGGGIEVFDTSALMT